MSLRRVILIAGATVVGVAASTVILAFLAPGMLLDMMEADSARRRVTHCQIVQIASVIREHGLRHDNPLSRDEIAKQLVEKQSFRSCGQDPFTARDALKDPWGDEFCLLLRSPTSMLVFSKNYVFNGRISAAVIDAGIFKWEDVGRGLACP
jgi:hypothetical protein